MSSYLVMQLDALIVGEEAALAVMRKNIAVMYFAEANFETGMRLDDCGQWGWGT